MALDQSYGGAFVRAEPPGYVPLCEYCPAPKNPYNGTVNPEDYTSTFLLGFPPNAAIADEQWATDPGAVQLHPTPYRQPPPGGTGPLSQYFARLVRIVRPPVH